MIRSGLLLHILLYISFFTAGQSYAVKSFFAKEGFTGGKPKIILQDQNGYLWCGTSDGLLKFDGKHFTEFTTKDGLSSNLIYDLKEDKDGRILIATQNGYCEYYQNKITKFRRGVSTNTYAVNSICVLKDGKIVISIGTYGLYYRTDTTLIPFQSPLDKFIQRGQTGLSKTCISLFTCPDGSLLAGTATGLFSYDGNAARHIVQLPSGKNCKMDSLGNIYTSGNNSIYRLRKENVLDSFQLSENTFAFLKDGRLIIFGEGRFYTLDGSRLYQLPVEEKEMPEIDVVGIMGSIFVDREDCIWMCYEYGLVRLKQLPFIRTTADKDKGREKFFEKAIKFKHPSLSDRSIRRVIMKMKLVFPDLNDVVSFLIISEDNFSLIGHSNIIWYKNGLINKYTINNSNDLNLFYHITDPNDGNYWYTGPAGTYIFKNGKLNKMSDVYQIDKNKFDHTARISSAWKDKFNRIWLTNPSDLAYWDGTNFVIVDVGNAGYRLRRSSIDPSGHQILYFNRLGLFFLDFLSDSSYKVIAKLNDLPEYRAFLYDSSGNFWYFGKQMIKVFKLNKEGIPDTSKVQNILRTDEISDMFSDRGYLFNRQLSGDSLILYGREYTYRFSIRKFLDEYKVLPVNTFLEGIELFLRPVNWKDLGFTINRDGVPENLVLPFNKNSLLFRFKGISTANSENITYSYLLKGYDADWHPATLENSASYSNLPPGTYNFSVRTINGNNEKGPVLTYQFTILPPWWASGWFRVCIFLAVIAFITMLMRFRTASLKIQKSKLEEKIKIRTLELENSIINLETSNKQNELFISVLAHDIKGPARFSADVSESLIDLWETGNNKDKFELALELKKTTKALYNFLTNFLTWLKQKDETQTLKEYICIRSLFEEVFKYHKETGNCIGNQLVIEAQNDIIVHTNKKYLEIIILNLVDNACKYTSHGVITLSAYTTDTGTIISCSDTGSGMTQEQVGLLLTFEGNRLPVHTGSFRMGYLFIKDLINKIGAKINIVSEVEKGTKVNIIMRRLDN